MLVKVIVLTMSALKVLRYHKVFSVFRRSVSYTFILHQFFQVLKALGSLCS